MGSMKMDQWKLFNMNDRIKGFKKKQTEAQGHMGQNQKL